MGCKWSGPEKDEDFQHWAKQLQLDPEEEHMHIKAWKTSAVRARVSTDDLEPGNNTAFDRSQIVGAARSMMSQLDGETPIPKPKPPAHKTSVEPDSPSDRPKSSDKADWLRQRQQEIENTRKEQRQQELANLDPEGWEKLAEQGYFQQAEDDLMAAADFELETKGRTIRYAMCFFALGSLYDYRSNIDQTGQQQFLSLRSAKEALQAVDTLRLLGRAKDVRVKLADALLLRGRSLCNVGLDGDYPEMTADESFSIAEPALKEAAQIREEENDQGLAEAVMAIGYLFYCKANSGFNQDMLAGYVPDCAGAYIPYIPENDGMYAETLSHYQRALQLYIAKDGESSADAIRMRCNIALVYKTWSLAPHPRQMEYIDLAEKEYQTALKLQEKMFGKRHPRSQRIQYDLREIATQKANIEANQVYKPQEMQNKEKEALMEEFLKARREERQREQQSAPSVARSVGKGPTDSV